MTGAGQCGLDSPGGAEMLELLPSVVPAAHPDPDPDPDPDPQASTNIPNFLRVFKRLHSCKLWMKIGFFILVLFLVITISLVLSSGRCVDDDENETPVLAVNKTFLVRLQIPEECEAKEQALSNQLTSRLTDVYKSSPALSPYFLSIAIADSSCQNATTSYYLQFALPEESNDLVKYIMSEEFVFGVLRQNFHDQSIDGCEALGQDADSFSSSCE
ncbi:TPA-induced transmembrane protein [Tachyglossus aculeatus]|uniref:TPA-induced transmembrane protein n=1 Tax=Tachyglossus aculeatus TaxID=9261 RepID=UPI0018F55417|nr:TPA-induced transmembrane protein [Tachyglossus aculeatus]